MKNSTCSWFCWSGSHIVSFSSQPPDERLSVHKIRQQDHGNQQERSAGPGPGAEHQAAASPGSTDIHGAEERCVEGELRGTDSHLCEQPEGAA